ncbi:uncharacterized family 31 glucosidase kiaa1161-like [Plakobranchus ocellatus]|uniref:Uncharacterized family 31 glucosidase kiaa1161-like n=1 Tax=Plakobranchus ocellatus TaxID=259542 RepID=A0AAV3Y2F2_9GAST|nr:uncharacterized family 31 glucosidase kiaa1161-like [Plakobranchus ocellatus]
MTDLPTQFIIEEDMNDNMQVPKRKLTRYMKIAAGTCIIAIILIIIAVLSMPKSSKNMMYTQGHSLKILDDQIEIGPSADRSLVSMDTKSNSLLFTVHGSRDHYLKVKVPHKLVKVVNDPSSPCAAFGIPQQRKHDSQETYAGISGKMPQMCLYFEEKLHAAIYDTVIAGMQCHHVHWFTNDTNSHILNSIDMTESNWYGGGGLSEQRWPLQRVNVPLQPYLTHKFDYSKDVKFDSFIEPYFLSANGAAVMVDSYLPLFVSINNQRDNNIVLKSIFEKPFSARSFENGLSLSYKVCKDTIARTVHQRLARLRLSAAAPKAPSVDLLQFPIWSSRAFTEENLLERDVIMFVKNITYWQLPYSHLFIEGNYSKEAGVFFFNEHKFPHTHQLFMEWQRPLNSRSQKLFVSTEVSPFVPKSGVPAAKSHFALRYKDNVKQVSASGMPNYLDVTNDEAVEWYKSQLSLVEGIGVQGFFFADGHAQNIVFQGVEQSDLVTSKPLLHPNQYTELYNKIAGVTATSSSNRGLSILASGYKAQQFGLLSDAGPFTSTWDFRKGLKAIIPTTITYGLLGYPFVLTGPVGGVFRTGPTGSPPRPSPNLYIRWLSLAAHLPALELSWGPWLYGPEVISYARSLLEYRKDVLWPKYLSEAVEEAARIGTPIVRPLWWIAPQDTTAQFINCEFMVGSRLLVAPVLNDQMMSRSVYLPEGSHWHDILKDRVHKGGQWLQHYAVGLYETATFERLIDA